MGALSQRLPVLFLSHGSPMSGFQEDEQSDFWRKLGSAIRKHPGIKALLFVSGHWEERPLRVNTTATPETIYDFYGFPAEFYRYKYPAKGSPEVAQRIMQLLSASKLPVLADPKHGLDHGTWVPLKWLLPGGDLPVVQLSLLDGGSMEEHIALGKALRPLRDEGILIVGSGTPVHNLRDMGRYFHSNSVASYVAPFDEALEKVMVGAKDGAEREKRLLELEAHPLLRKAHPSLEHLLPLHVAGGAAGDDIGRKVYTKFELSFSSSSYILGPGLDL